ncbi:MAG: YihY/virulence factor BrkB family protein [Sphaerochaetaceae bacterium]
MREMLVKENSKVRKVWTFIEVWFGKSNNDRITILASGVAFSTLISIVPFFSFLVAFLSLFDMLLPFFSLINEVFASIFGEAAGGELARMIRNFTMNARGLGAFGLISFLVTSLLLLNKVWSVVNQIYRSNFNSVNVVKRSAGFLTALVVGAILLGIYFSAKSLMSSWFSSLLGWNLSATFFTSFIQMFIPWVAGWVFLFFIITSAPNAKVDRISATIGALAGTVGTIIVNALFSTLISNLIGYSVIYGSFAAVFLFLVWVYFLWVVVLGAVEVSYIHQYQPEKETIKKPVSPSDQVSNGINVMMIIAKRYRQGEGETRIRDLAQVLLLNERQLFSILDELSQLSYIIATNNFRSAFIPARPLEDIIVADLVSSLYGKGGSLNDSIGSDVARRFELEGLLSLKGLSIDQLLTQSDV